MNLQVIILTHAAAQPIFERHWPLWEAHKAPIMVVSPEDGTRIPERVTHIKSGAPEQFGQYAFGRIWRTVQMAAGQKFSHYLIFEYDSFCLDPKTVRFENGLFGNTFRNIDGREHTDFIAPTYPNPPWLVDSDSIRLMAHKARIYPSVEEKGYNDRYLAALAFLAGVPILDHIPKGYSLATIEPSNTGPMQDAILAGARMIHGVKSASVLNTAMNPLPI